MSWAKQALQEVPSPYVPGDAAGTALAGGGSGSKLLLLLALLAAGAAAAAVVLTGRGTSLAAAWGPAWVRRRLRSNGAAEAEEDEGIELLQRGAAGVHNGGARYQRTPQPRELAPGRARLKALVQRQLGGTALLSGRPEAELLSMLNGTAHNLIQSLGGPLPAAASNRSWPNYPASAALGGTSVRLVRPWGLPTESLRMPAADLQVWHSGWCHGVPAHCTLAKAGSSRWCAPACTRLPCVVLGGCCLLPLPLCRAAPDLQSAENSLQLPSFLLPPPVHCRAGRQPGPAGRGRPRRGVPG